MNACPRCGTSVTPGATDCARCRLVFGPDAMPRQDESTIAAEAPAVRITGATILDCVLLLIFGAAASLGLVAIIPWLTAFGVTFSRQRGAEIGGMLLAMFNPVLPFFALAAILYVVARTRKTQPVVALCWVAVAMALALVVPLASSVIPELGDRFGFVGLERYPVGFALFYFFIGFVAIYGTYHDLARRKTPDTPVQGEPPKQP